MDPQVSFGTVDEILTSSSILITEHQYHLSLLRFPSAISVDSEEEKRKELDLLQDQERREKRKWKRRLSRQMRKIKRREMGPKQEPVTNLANRTMFGRDWDRHEYKRAKVNVFILRVFYIELLLRRPMWQEVSEWRRDS